MYYQIRITAKVPKNPVPPDMGTMLVVLDVLVDALNDWGHALETEARLDRMLRNRETGFIVPYGCTHMIPLATLPANASLQAFIRVSD